jgi:hypothetical protein
MHARCMCNLWVRKGEMCVHMNMHMYLFVYVCVRVSEHVLVCMCVSSETLWLVCVNIEFAHQKSLLYRSLLSSKLIPAIAFN